MMDWLTHNAPIIGLLFFFIFFCGVCAWLYWPGMRDRHEAHAMIPLKEDDRND